ncbi:FMN-binding protein [Spirillospora sp. NPDC047279]|uniref:FMN-binding protein n=1 Tax=Spirillospora sp. NPDC047279 TaxID=3155478 RepID=UPI0033E85E7F
MRRTTAAVVGTLGGAALLLAAKYGADANADKASQAAGQTGELAPAAEGGEVSPSAPANPPATRAPAASPSRSAPARAANGLKNGLFRGDAVRNQYGPIQVTIRVANGRVTALAATHATSPAMTVQVNKRAIPLLRQAALTSQSAQVDTVSGATFTSGSFNQSLQSALAAAKA